MGKIEVSCLFDSDYINTAQFLIERAEREIFLSTFRLQIFNRLKSSKFLGLYSALIHALKRGVDVRVLTQFSAIPGKCPRSNTTSMRMLRDKGARVRFLSGGRIAHAKILCIDETYLISGSHNWSASSLCQNFEFSVLARDPAQVAGARAHFLAAWDAAVDFAG